jgi:hypothetical protein
VFAARAETRKITFGSGDVAGQVPGRTREIALSLNGRQKRPLSGFASGLLLANFAAPPFLRRGPSYMKDSPPGCADHPQERIGGVDDGGGFLIQISRSATRLTRSADRYFNRDMAWAID